MSFQKYQIFTQEPNVTLIPKSSLDREKHVDRSDTIIIVKSATELKKTGKKRGWDCFAKEIDDLKIIENEATNSWDALLKPHKIKPECTANSFFSFERLPGKYVFLVIPPKSHNCFDLLRLYRKIVAKINELTLSSSVLVSFSFSGEEKSRDLLLRNMDALISSLNVATYEPYKENKKNKKSTSSAKDQESKSLSLLVTHDLKTDKNFWLDLKSQCLESFYQARGCNFVRYLSDLPANILTPKSYVSYIQQLAKEHKLGFKFYDFNALKKLNAGAFLAVAQGSSHQDGGIIELEYQAKDAKKNAPEVVFVGKGITYDTGGTNLKPARYMFGMHRDMAGSAVALTLILLARKESWNLNVKTYLAITDNAIGEKAFRPNELVKTLSGITIETVHTDAEGRMILSDTLALASKNKPKLMMDFATLTGACVHAIGTTYSGVFSNRIRLHPKLIKAGRTSGERVWPFPVSKDFGECLKSDIADIKQCRLTGGVDHIEAAIFLKSFVDKSIDWVHVDLSSIENEGGLAHVETANTGFGIRFSKAFLKSYLGSKFS